MCRKLILSLATGLLILAFGGLASQAAVVAGGDPSSTATTSMNSGETSHSITVTEQNSTKQNNQQVNNNDQSTVSVDKNPSWWWWPGWPWGHHDHGDGSNNGNNSGSETGEDPVDPNDPIYTDPADPTDTDPIDPNDPIYVDPVDPGTDTENPGTGEGTGGNTGSVVGPSTDPGEDNREGGSANVQGGGDTDVKPEVTTPTTDVDKPANNGSQLVTDPTDNGVKQPSTDQSKETTHHKQQPSETTKPQTENQTNAKETTSKTEVNPLQLTANGVSDYVTNLIYQLVSNNGVVSETKAATTDSDAAVQQSQSHQTAANSVSVAGSNDDLLSGAHLKDSNKTDSTSSQSKVDAALGGSASDADMLQGGVIVSSPDHSNQYTDSDESNDSSVLVPVLGATVAAASMIGIAAIVDPFKYLMK